MQTISRQERGLTLRSMRTGILYKNEMLFRQALVKRLRDNGWEVQPVEVGAINVGVPDLFMAKKGISCWCELKNIHTNPKDTLSIDFRRGQQAWHYKYMKQGVKTCVMIATPDWIIVHRFNRLLKDNLLNLQGQDVMYCQMSNVSDTLWRLWI